MQGPFDYPFQYLNALYISGQRTRGGSLQVDRVAAHLIVPKAPLAQLGRLDRGRKHCSCCVVPYHEAKTKGAAGGDGAG